MPIFFANGGVSITPKVQSEPAAPSGNNLLSSLISHWSLDEASGARADSHGSNNLTDNNTVGSNTGIISNGADFVAANSEYLNIASNASLQTGDIDFAVSFWFKTDSVSGNRFIIMKDQGSGIGREWRVDLNGSQLRAFIFNSTNGVAANANSSVTISTGTWYHVLMWHDASGNTLYIRVNDTTENSAAASGTITTKTCDFVMGANTEAGGTNFFDGILDECSFWKRLLTSGEKTDLYNSGSGRAYSYYE